MEVTRKERAEGPEKFLLQHVCNVQCATRDSHRHHDIVNSHRTESAFTPRSRSRRPLILTRGISCRALSITPIDYLLARSPLSNLSRDRDTSFHCLAYAADKPIASAVDVNAFGCGNYSVCVHVWFIH